MDQDKSRKNRAEAGNRGPLLLLSYAGALEAPETGRRFTLDGDELIIGRSSDAHQIDRVFEQDTGGALFFALNRAARRIGRGVVDAGQLQRAAIRPGRMTVFANEQRGPPRCARVEIGLAIMAALRGEAIPAVGTTTFRPPYTPVALGLFAGAETGKHQTPVRRTPLHNFWW